MFVTLIKEIQFNKVTYYSVIVEEKEESLFLQFINNHSDKVYFEQIGLIRSWLIKIGNEIGAYERYFRNEAFRGDARALPPPAKHIGVDCNLRLYCMRINQNIVILFNGGEKTAKTAQECNIVRPHFLLANKLTKAIDQAIREKDIQIDIDQRILVYDDNLEIEL